MQTRYKNKYMQNAQILTTIFKYLLISKNPEKFELKYDMLYMNFIPFLSYTRIYTENVGYVIVVLIVNDA